MGAITPKILETRGAVVKKSVIFIAEDVSTGDTITLHDLSAIDGAAALNREDGSAVTQTVATNVITIGGSYSDIDVIGIAVGDSE